MIRLIGELSLLTALCFALLQFALPAWGYIKKNTYLLASARTLALGQCLFILLSFALLTAAFITSDFSIAYVAANSHPNLPFMYRLTALWGAHEGSLLLWIAILNGWTMAYTVIGKQHTLPFYSLVIAILGLISVCFLAFLYVTSNPFLAAAPFQTGKDLNPLLQDPGFVIHPPMLYAGYVGFSVAFALTQAALIHGSLEREWARLTRQFALAAWCFLTGGILLGSWWAYRVLGWGGFWFWDPVENASLLPWLTGTALIHILLLSEKRGTARGWATLLAILTFAMSLLGTFLVRSGVLISVHTFANDPARGAFLLCLLTFLLTAAFLIYAIRLPTIQLAKRPPIPFFSRDMLLTINSALLFVSMLTILLGTLYPLILDALHLGTISVGAPYFNLVMLPLLLIILLFMGFGPLCQWQSLSPKTVLRLAWPLIGIASLGAYAILWLILDDMTWVSYLSLALSLWVILSVRHHVRILPGMSLSHMGFAILVIGITLSSFLNQEQEMLLHTGNAAKIGPYQFFFMGTKETIGQNYRGIQGVFDVIKNKHHIAYLHPEKRIYPVREMVITKVDIHPSIFRDLYIALGNPRHDDLWSVRIYYKPFVRWIWAGGIIMILGGIVNLLLRKTSRLHLS